MLEGYLGVNRISTVSCLGFMFKEWLLKSHPLCMRFKNKRLNCATMFVYHVLTFDFFFTMGEFDYVFVCMFYFCLLLWSIMLVSNNILQNESGKIAPTTINSPHPSSYSFNFQPYN